MAIVTKRARSRGVGRSAAWPVWLALSACPATITGPMPQNGACGTAANTAVSAAPTANLCATGTASTVTGAGPFSWTCAGAAGGSIASCMAPAISQSHDGACGSANGVAVMMAPSTGLCAAGTASAVAGSGPFTWTCASNDGGAAASCSAPLLSAPPPAGWARLHIGGGGFVDGQSIPSGTGVRFQRTDAGGAYVWSAGKWQQLLTLRSMPASDFGENGHGLQVDELAGCNSDAACAYMYYGGYVFFSSNINTTDPSGITFCRDSGNLAQQTADPGSLFPTRAEGPTLAVDPNNKDHVVLGTTANGLYETFNGTSCNPTWTPISSASIPTSGAHGYRIAFDPTATATCHSGAGTCSRNAFVWTSGSPAGVYATTDAGQTWSLTPGGPAAVQRMKVSFATAGGGNLWVTDGSSVVWRRSGATWLQMASNVNGSSLAINPKNGDHVAVMAGSATVRVSTNASSAAPAFTDYTASISPGDAPWQEAMQLNRGAASSDIDFEPDAGDVLLGELGQGVWTSPLPTGSFTWTSQVDGIEELLLTGKSAVQSQGNVTFGAQDQGSCRLSAPYNLSKNAQDCGPLSNYGFLQYASGLSVTPDHSLMFTKVSPDFGPGFDYSGTSTDGLYSNYTPLSLWSANVTASALADNGSGGTRVTVPSTTGLTTWSAGAGSIVCGMSELLTWQNSWSTRCFPAAVVDATHVDLQGATFAAPPSGPHTGFIFFVPGTALISWSGGGTVTNVTNDNGSVRVTTAGQVVYNGALVCLSGVMMTGATKVNGCWVATQAAGNSFDLGPASSFAASDTYVTGGEAKTWGAPGGSIAAASKSNWTMYGGDRTFPMCTDNGGATYSQVDAPGGPLALTTVTGGPYMAGASSFAVADGTKVNGYQIYVQLVSGRLINDVGYTVMGNTVTLNGVAVPPGDSIASGAAVFNSTGWPFAAYFYTVEIAADQVTPNTFYGVNTDWGLLKWTHCNPPTLVTDTGPNGGFLQWTFHGTLRAVPGEAGHLFYTPGPQGSGLTSSGTSLWRTCNGVNDTTNSVTWSRVPGFFSPQTVGFGQGAPGKSYAAVIVAGWYAADDTQADAVYGVWRSIDDGSHGSTAGCTNGTWQNLTPDGGYADLDGWPVLPIWDAVGDPFVYGPVYVGASIGAWYGNFP
jgi:hypothetical protein